MGYCRIFWNIRAYSGIFRTTSNLELCGLLLANLEYFGIFWNIVIILGHPGIFWNVLEYCEMQDILEYCEIFSKFGIVVQKRILGVDVDVGWNVDISSFRFRSTFSMLLLLTHAHKEKTPAAHHGCLGLPSPPPPNLLSRFAWP